MHHVQFLKNKANLAQIFQAVIYIVICRYCSLSRRGNYVCGLTQQGVVTLWSMYSGQRVFHGSMAHASAIEAHPHKALMALGTSKGQVHVYRLAHCGAHTGVQA